MISSYIFTLILEVANVHTLPPKYISELRLLNKKKKKKGRKKEKRTKGGERERKKKIGEREREKKKKRKK